jgi:ribosomal-protein-alanine N-acetyltransferase
MVTLETDRLLIRNFRRDDWRDLQAMIVQYQSSEVGQYDHPWPVSDDEIQGVTEWFASGDRFLAVCLKAPEVFIGFISLNREEQDGEVEYHLGYVFNSDYGRRGYATEGCRAVIDYAFDVLSVESVVSNTAAANDRSCRLLRRLGMEEIRQGTASFRGTDDGQSIEFRSVSFALSRQSWLRREGAGGQNGTG